MYIIRQAFCGMMILFPLFSSTQGSRITGQLGFTVRSIDGALIPNAVIHVAHSFRELGSDQFIATQRTGSDGKASFGTLDTGYYFFEVEVSKDGIYRLEDSVVVRVDRIEHKEVRFQFND